MAVILEFYSLVIRRDRLEAAFPGGWPQYLAEYGEPFEGWMDEDLLRYGAMNTIDLYLKIEHWRRRGLRLLGRRNGRELYLDMWTNAAPSVWSGADCDWLEIIDGSGEARFIGKPYRQRLPLIVSDWSKELIRFSEETIRQWLAKSPDSRGSMFLENWDNYFGKLDSEDESEFSLLVTDLRTGERSRYRRINHLLNAGWIAR